jgi:hypothetical protein
MTPVRRFDRLFLGIALAIALAWIAAPAARADEAGEEVGVPAPEQASAEEPAAAPEVQTAMPTGTPSYATTSESISAVHRPGGVWGPLAIAADLLVMRPIGFVSLAAGGAAFVLVSPVAAVTQTLGSRVDALGERARDVFTRPLGEL